MCRCFDKVDSCDDTLKYSKQMVGTAKTKTKLSFILIEVAVQFLVRTGESQHTKSDRGEQTKKRIPR